MLLPVKTASSAADSSLDSNANSKTRERRLWKERVLSSTMKMGLLVARAGWCGGGMGIVDGGKGVEE